jgi:hypothetical protein
MDVTAPKGRSDPLFNPKVPGSRPERPTESQFSVLSVPCEAALASGGAPVVLLWSGQGRMCGLDRCAYSSCITHSRATYDGLPRRRVC